VTGIPAPPSPIDDELRATLKAAKDKLMATGRFAYARASMIAYFAGPHAHEGYVTIDLVDKGDEARMKFADPPIGAVDDPGGLVAAWQAYEQKFLELLQAGALQIGTEPPPCRALHCLSFDHPDLAPYDERFAREVPPHFADLVKVLREDADPEKRGAAAYLLAYGSPAQAVVDALVPSVRDGDSLVRNDVIRVFTQLPQRAPDANVPLAPFLDALDFPDTTDRNKAAYALLALASRAPDDCRGPILGKDGDILLAMLALAQPNNRDPARRILAALAGKDLGEDVGAWNAWLRSARGR
jgi:hypothetical protein